MPKGIFRDCEAVAKVLEKLRTLVCHRYKKEHGLPKGRPCSDKEDKNIIMAINSEVIIWTCVTVAVLVGICAIVLIAMSSRNMKKNREAMRDLQGAIKVGARIMFAGGIYGKIVKIKNDVIDVEINKSTVIQISRYSIQNVITD